MTRIAHENHPATAARTPAVPRAVLRRAWTVEASWHALRMQGLGALYALVPVLRGSTGGAAALKRHAGYFNVNAWMAPALLGALARLEQENRGTDALRLRDVVTAPLSGAGDLFVWSALRPACLLLAIAGVLVGHPVWGGALALAAYDVPLLVLYCRNFALGASAGADLARLLPSVQPSLVWVRWLRVGIAVGGGALLAWGVVHGARLHASTAFPVGAAVLLGYYAAKRQVSPGMTFLILVALASLARHLQFSNPVGLP